MLYSRITDYRNREDNDKEEVFMAKVQVGSWWVITRKGSRQRGQESPVAVPLHSRYAPLNAVVESTICFSPSTPSLSLQCRTCLITTFDCSLPMIVHQPETLTMSASLHRWCLIHFIYLFQIVNISCLFFPLDEVQDMREKIF